MFSPSRSSRQFQAPAQSNQEGKDKFFFNTYYDVKSHKPPHRMLVDVLTVGFIVVTSVAWGNKINSIYCLFNKSKCERGYFSVQTGMRASTKKIDFQGSAKKITLEEELTRAKTALDGAEKSNKSAKEIIESIQHAKTEADLEKNERKLKKLIGTTAKNEIKSARAALDSARVLLPQVPGAQDKFSDIKTMENRIQSIENEINEIQNDAMGKIAAARKQLGLPRAGAESASSSGHTGSATASAPGNNGASPGTKPVNSGSATASAPRNNGASPGISPVNSGSATASAPGNNGTSPGTSPGNSGSATASAPSPGFSSQPTPGLALSANGIQKKIKSFYINKFNWQTTGELLPLIKDLTDLNKNEMRVRNLDGKSLQKYCDALNELNTSPRQPSAYLKETIATAMASAKCNALLKAEQCNAGTFTLPGTSTIHMPCPTR